MCWDTSFLCLIYWIHINTRFLKWLICIEWDNHNFWPPLYSCRVSHDFIWLCAESFCNSSQLFTQFTQSFWCLIELFAAVSPSTFASVFIKDPGLFPRGVLVWLWCQTNAGFICVWSELETTSSSSTLQKELTVWDPCPKDWHSPVTPSGAHIVCCYWTNVVFIPILDSSMLFTFCISSQYSLGGLWF